MAQNKKAKPAAGKRKSARGGISWQNGRKENKTKLLGMIALVGVIAVVAGYFLQSSALLSVQAGGAGQENTVRINEIVAENLSTLVTEHGDVPDWIEITNTGSEDVQVGKYALMLKSNINRMFTFPKYSLKSGECLVIRAEGMNVQGKRGEWSAPFKLDASGGDVLILLNASGKAIDSVELPELDADAAYARQDDGSWLTGSATPGADNASRKDSAEEGVRIVADAIEISEAMSSNTLYFADENGQKHDYVEIHNKSGQNVNLKGWWLSDSSDKLKRWEFPDVTLPAGGYLAVHCSGKDLRSDAAHLHSDFKIGSNGETLYLSRPDGQTVSCVELPALASGQAYSLADGKWTTDIAPTPGLENTPGAASQVQKITFGDLSSGVFISEVMASPTDQNYDWVEIHNASAQAVNLSGFGLSDSPDKPRKWQFPQGTTIQPGEYMGVFLSGTNQAMINGFLNADFALGAGGGYSVTLSDPNGRVFDAAYMGGQYGGVSYGRSRDDMNFYFFDGETPGQANSGARFYGRAEKAKASVEGGLFRTGEAFQVELSAPAGSRIHYTLDSSDPTENSNLYTGPISVSSTTVLRTKVFRDGYLPSYADTQSYIFDVQNASGAYVISLVSDMKNLTGDSGIMSNYMEDWEKEAHFELFTPEGERVLGQNCGISLHGMDSRKLPIKSFNVIARREYDEENRFNYPVFSGRDYPQYQSLLLRASGEDYNLSFMRDTTLSSLMKGSSVLYQENELAIVYLDGQYYTLCYIRERINEHSICQFEGWEGCEDIVDLVKGNSSVNQGSNETFASLLKWVKNNDTTTDAAYAYIDSQIDIQNFIEYMAVEIFVANSDTLNVRRYRNAQADGKWRWALFDLDWAFFNDTDSIRDWLTSGGAGAANATDNTLFIACMKNPTFRDQFITHMGNQLAGPFSSENVVQAFRDRYALIEGNLPQYLERWNITLDTGIKKVVSYAETRPTKIIGYFRDVFNFSDAEMEKYFGAAIEKIRAYESEVAANGN